jgi:hypothetical protein
MWHNSWLVNMHLTIFTICFDFDQVSFEKVSFKVFIVPFNLDGDQSIFVFIATTL